MPERVNVSYVAQNREYPKELNNIPCVVWSCIKMHATHEIVNIQKGEITFRAWFGLKINRTLM